jgi:hypothetical protein
VVRLGEQVEVGAERGQRRPELVTGVGDQLALPVPRGGQRGQHRVEGASEAGDLVVALHLDRVELLGAGDVLGRVREPADRSQAVAGDGPTGERGGDHPRQPEQEHREAELAERLLVGLQRLGDHQGDAGLLGLHGGHPVVAALGLDGAAGVLRVTAGDRQLRPAELDGVLGGTAGGRDPAGRGDVPDPGVGGAQHPRRDVLHRELGEVVLRGGLGPALQRLVHRGLQLVTDGEVRRQGDERYREADCEGGEQDDPARQRLPVVRPAGAPAHVSLSTYPTPRTVWISRGSFSASVLRRR